MSDEINDMLSQRDKDISNQKLLDYLNNKLPAEEEHDLEKHIIDTPFVNDAVEGLGAFKNRSDLLKIADQLNGDLRKQLQAKKKKRLLGFSANQPIIILAIIITIALVILGYLIIIRHLK